MVLPLREAGFVFQIDEQQRVKEINNSLQYRKYFTESASIPDLHPPKIGLYLIGFARDRFDALAIGVSTGVTQTQSARIKLKRLIKFPQTSLKDIIPDDDFGKKIRKLIVEQNKVKVQSGTFNAMIRNIARLFPDRVPEIDNLINIANGIDFDKDPKKASLFAQQQDAMRTGLSGFNLKVPAYEDAWELDEYEGSLAYIDGYQTLGEYELVTEDEIANHDLQYFPDFVHSDKYHIKTNAFTDGNDIVLVSMANRNAIEDVLGVDLVYYDEVAESFCLVQYKRMIQHSGKFVYYPSSDGNYKKDMKLMKSHTATFKEIEKAHIGSKFNRMYDNYRIFDGHFFFKFARSINFEPFHNRVIPGYYIPFDMWVSLVEECKDKNSTLKACAETLTKFIATKEFCELLKRGMIGSRRCSADSVVQVMAECLRGNRSVVFAHKREKNDEEKKKVKSGPEVDDEDESMEDALADA